MQFEIPTTIKMGLSATPRDVLATCPPNITPWPTADPLGAIDNPGQVTRPEAIEKLIEQNLYLSKLIQQNVGIQKFQKVTSYIIMTLMRL